MSALHCCLFSYMFALFLTHVKTTLSLPAQQHRKCRCAAFPCSGKPAPMVACDPKKHIQEPDKSHKCGIHTMLLMARIQPCPLWCQRCPSQFISTTACCEIVQRALLVSLDSGHALVSMAAAHGSSACANWLSQTHSTYEI